MASKPSPPANNNNHLIAPTGVVDASGNPFFRVTTDPSDHVGTNNVGGGSRHSDITELKTQLSGAFLWLTLLTGAAGAAFLYLMSVANDLRKDIGTVQASVAAQVATTAAIKESANRIETKLDKDHPDIAHPLSPPATTAR